MQQSIIPTLCNDETFVRSTLFCDIFQTTVNLDGESRAVDIERYAFPMNRQRIEYLKATYGVSEDELPTFYKWVIDALRNGILISNEMHQPGDENFGTAQSFVQYLHQSRGEQEMGGTYLYIMTNQKQRYLDSLDTEGNEVYLKEVMRLAAVLSRSIIRLHGRDLRIGIIDLEGMAITQHLVGGVMRPYRTISNMLFAAVNKQNKEYFNKILPNTTPKELLDGEQPTELTDTKALAMLIKAMVTGFYRRSEPLSEAIYPRNVPKPMEVVLEKTINGEIGLKEFNREISRIDSDKKWFESMTRTFRLDRTPMDFYHDKTVKVPEPEEGLEGKDEDLTPEPEVSQDNQPATEPEQEEIFQDSDQQGSDDISEKEDPPISETAPEEPEEEEYEFVFDD